ncbi:hypothetical protein N7532_011501 [Penicillium argentinense]|uniref:Synaptobrevin n=1 Tax=Penicillium argentinense TaxID=1131581 RepID=A0A9W9EII1_9EURO|nr:uncharacterized protein N7532_011501 [Penicillium argentinense]KAJ5082458.1 hypothetical protein N7532_011501 [Penicillium argentinense]
MAVTEFPSAGESPDLTLLNVARLFTRLEHNLVSPGAELRTLRRSEFQRMRVTKNVEYARILLSQLERSLPQLKQPDRRHEAQAEIARDRQLLKRMQTILDEVDSRADDNDEAEDDVDDEWKELFSKPIVEKVVSSADTTSKSQPRVQINETDTNSTNAPTTTTATATATFTPTPTPSIEPNSTLRNRNTTTSSPKQSTGHTTGSNYGQDMNASTEKALDNDRSEQEDLTGSLVSMATQLKAQSKSFQSTLESEKDALERAALGMDKTSSTMEAAGKRMGMLTRMSEGKGWWGRMMLYAWIFALWIVAILIVFVGPKLRF